MMPKESLLEDIVQKHYRRVFSYCLSILVNREMAEDACHDVFLKVQKNLDSLDADRNCTPWLLRIARNHCYDIYRKERRMYPEVDLENTLKEGSMGPEERLLEKEKLAIAIKAMSKLKPTYREILILRDVEHLSYREIAAHLEIERKKVKWMLFKARQKVKLFAGGMNEKSDV
jgi:RNA polymerase sigma-70 factor (ECF subfamily)